MFSNLPKFLTHCFPCPVRSPDGDDVLDDTPTQAQASHSIQEPDRVGELAPAQRHSYESSGGRRKEFVLITRIRAANVVVKLQRIPVAFYVVAQNQTVSQRTSNKAVSVDRDVVEWDDKLVLPLDRSSKLSLVVIASFELGRTLGNGEVLSQFETTIAELFDLGEERKPIKFLQQSDSDISSPLSLEVEIDRQVHNQDEYPAASELPESEVTRKLGEATDSGHGALSRYRKLQEQLHLDESIRHFEHARTLCPRDHPSYSTVLFNLATAKLICFRVDNISLDLDMSINLYRETLLLRPRGHPEHPFTLLSLAISLLARSQIDDAEADELEGRTLLSQVLEISQANGYVYHAAVLALASAAEFDLVNQMKAFQTIKDDLNDDKLLQRLDSSLQWMFCWDSSRPSLLDHIGILFCVRFEFIRDFSDPKRAIPMLEVAVQATSDDHPEKSSWLDNLGYLSLAQYRRSGAVSDLERSILMREEAVRLAPDGHPLKPSWLNNLGLSLSTRYRKFGNVADLDKAISMAESNVRLTPSTHPNKALGLNNLGSWLVSRYERLGDVFDLEKAILVFEDAVRLTPESHKDKALRLNNFGCSLWTRYEYSADVADLEKSISTFTDVASLTSDSHPEKSSRLHNLGISILTRYERFGNVGDLHKAISISEDVVGKTPDDHPNKPSRLNDLGNMLSTRYARFGDAKDLEKSISKLQEALKLAPDDDVDKSSWLNNLGHSLSTRYEHFGDVLDLEKAISMTENALQLTPDDHPRRPSRLSSLGGLLWMRYDCFGEVADLNKSILMFEDAVRLTPAGHSAKPSRLNNLGHVLSARYQRFGNVVDLETSVSKHEETLQLTPDDHPDKPSWTNNLGATLLARYERVKDVIDLQKSTLMLEDAVRLTPDGHPDKPSLLTNLGRSLFTLHQHSGDDADLQKSISVEEDAVELTPDGHPDKPLRLNSLALSLMERFRRSRDPSSPDLTQGILYSSQAARSSTGPSRHRFRASQIWIQCVRQVHPHDAQSLLDAYTVGIHLLSELAWIGLPLHDRYNQLFQAADTACDAAATALEVHRPELAVEWLEQGRSIVWSQLSQLRMPADDLRISYPELAARFERLSHQLEYASTRFDRAGTKDSESTNLERREGVSLQKQAQQHHTLALERESLLAEIRALPSFERFLLPKTIDQLSPLARWGPVIYLNASKHRCDALIVTADSERVVHVPLSEINYDAVASMQLRLSKVLGNTGRVIQSEEADRGARIQGMSAEEVFGSILSSLWDHGVSQILEVLALSKSGLKLPRVFWCPTGPFSFLPIHAAGHYGTTDPGRKLSDLVVSSYIPTMSALEVPRQEDTEATPHHVRLLAIPQPLTDGQAPLKEVKQEMDVIRKLASSSSLVTFEEADGTVEDVMAKMQVSDWVHFACHATQDRKNPLDSGLLLADGRRLRVSDMVRLSRPRGGLAFLSACQTATGDEKLSDEAIHIAAGMLLAGYGSVVATMWRIMDSDAPKITEDVYRYLFREGAEVPLDGREAAEALHRAVIRLRDESHAPFLSWVPFIHIGL